MILRFFNSMLNPHVHILQDGGLLVCVDEHRYSEHFNT